MSGKIETLRTFTPLGIRFWDPVLDDQIRDRLHVTIVSETGNGQPVSAYRTVSDIYAFNNLPGLRTIEYPADDRGQITSPAIPPHGYIVVVEDPFRRFIQTAFRVELPLLYTGVFLSRAADSPPQRFPRFILFSAPTRTTPFGTAVIRGELIDMTSDRPAGHALVRVREPAGRRWYGLADEAGRFSLFMPYPQLIGTFIGSPRIFIGQPLSEQTWELVVEVLYEPALLAPLPHTRLPEYLDILSQNPARIWMDLSDEGSPLGSGSAIFELPATLTYDRELTLRTEGLSKLAISPAKSPL